MDTRQRSKKPRLSSMDAAVHAMNPYGFSDEHVRRIVKQLLKEYGGDDGWHFIEENGYEVLVDAILVDLNDQESSAHYNNRLKNKSRVEARARDSVATAGTSGVATVTLQDTIKADSVLLGGVRSSSIVQPACTEVFSTISSGIHTGAVNVGTSQFVNEIVNPSIERTSFGFIRKKLLVLDINGLLVDILSYRPRCCNVDAIISNKAVFKRPYCDDFLKFCFENFNVGVWSSRSKSNLASILNFLLGNDKCKLVFCWDQSHCTNSGYCTLENKDKPLFLKKLKRLWENYEDLPWDKGVYNETNTLLVDDSPYKALCNPPNTAIFPHPYKFTDMVDNSLGPGGHLRTYLEGLTVAANVQEYVARNPFGQSPIRDTDVFWPFYGEVVKANSSPPRKTDA